VFLGRVTGTVVSTVHHPFYHGRTLLLVDRVNGDLEPDGGYVIAVDAVDAGAGELVLLIDEGNSARQVTGEADGPVRAVIVGVVDEVRNGERVWTGS
jgi:ethanolamine utilization protein EutN